MVLFVSLFTFLRPDQEVFTYMEIAGKGQKNVGLCSALMAFKQRWVFIVPHLL
jgi:hypothetical protein